MAENDSFDVSLCGNMTEHYQTVWRKFEFWCEGIIFSSLGLFGNFYAEQTLVLRVRTNSIFMEIHDSNPLNNL